MTTTTDTTKLPCGRKDECLHPTCTECGDLMRGDSGANHGHPGTRHGFMSRGICARCRRRQKDAEKRQDKNSKEAWFDRIGDLPTEDERIRHADPGLWRMIKKRRHDGVPASGKRFKGEL